MGKEIDICIFSRLITMEMFEMLVHRRTLLGISIGRTIMTSSNIFYFDMFTREFSLARCFMYGMGIIELLYDVIMWMACTMMNENGNCPLIALCLTHQQ